MSGIDESSIDHDPERKSLAAALHSVDNLQALLNNLCSRHGAKAVAINVGISADGRVSVYVTADDSVDEERVGRRAAEMINELFSFGAEKAHRAQRIRDIVAQQWAVAMALLDSEPSRLWRDDLYPAGVIDGHEKAFAALAALPSATEIVGGEP